MTDILDKLVQEYNENSEKSIPIKIILLGFLSKIESDNKKSADRERRLVILEKEEIKNRAKKNLWNVQIPVIISITAIIINVIINYILK